MDAALELAKKYGAKIEDDEAIALARKYGAFSETQKQDKPKATANFWDAVKEVARPEFPLASVIRGATSLAGSAGDLWGALSYGLADTAARFTGGDRQTFRDLAAPEIPFPTTESLRGAVERKIGPLAQPEGRVGLLVGGAIEGAASSPFGKPMAVMGGLSGFSSEWAGQLTEGTKLEPWARPAAGLLAPAGFQGWKQWKDAPGWMLREATGDVTPQQWAEAQRRMEMGRKYGIDLTAPEAMPPSSIQQLASDVAASKTGGRVFNDFMARRPGQIKSAVEKNLLDPIGAANTPDVNMARAREAADAVIHDAQKFRTEATRPYYLEQKKADLGGMLLEAQLPGLAAAEREAQRRYAELLGLEGQFKTFGAQNTVKGNNWYPVPGMPRVPGGASNFPERAREGADSAADVARRIPTARAEKNSAEAAIGAARSELESRGYGKVAGGVESIIGNIDAEIAAAGAGTDKAKILKELRDKLAPGGVPLDKPYKLEGVYQETSKRLDVPINAPVQDRIAAGVLGEHVASLDDLIKQSSGTLKAGRELYKEVTERIVNPLTSGPVGRVAGRQGFDPSVPQNLNPVASVSNESVARPESIRELYTQLGTQDKRAFPGIARTWLENAFDQATQRVQAGENRMMGANFAKSVYGTDQQIANFAETMRGVAYSHGVKDPDGFVKGAKNLMEILQMTGKVPGIGSPTGGRIATNEMARSSRVAGAMESVSTAPLTPMATKIRDWAMQGNYQRLAEVLTSPDAIKKIQALGKYAPTTTAAQALAVSIIGANEAAQ